MLTARSLLVLATLFYISTRARALPNSKNQSVYDTAQNITLLSSHEVISSPSNGTTTVSEANARRWRWEDPLTALIADIFKIRPLVFPWEPEAEIAGIRLLWVTSLDLTRSSIPYYGLAVDELIPAKICFGYIAFEDVSYESACLVIQQAEYGQTLSTDGQFTHGPEVRTVSPYIWPPIYLYGPIERAYEKLSLVTDKFPIGVEANDFEDTSGWIFIMQKEPRLAYFVDMATGTVRINLNDDGKQPINQTEAPRNDLRVNETFPSA